jgi:outer membrane protein assembly factor BamA
LVTIDQIPRAYTDTVDFIVRLTPARKYVFDANIEGSQNWGNIFTQGNLIGFNFGFQNRNFARGANLANTNFRFGTEIAPSKQGRERFAQTLQFSLGNSIQFPRFIPSLPIAQKFKENSRTIFSLNAAYTSRYDFFNLTSFNTSWGYEINWKNKLLSIRFPNIEFALLDTGTILKNLIAANASYQYIFNGGLVASSMAGLTITGGQKNITRSLRLNGETSGILLGLIPSKSLERNLQRFVRGEIEFRQTHKIRRSAFAMRGLFGAGYQLRSERFRYNQNLPFFRSFISGGANSMRAWQLRKLGPGSTVKSFARDSFPDRFGDLQLELNAEYRFYITDVRGVKLNSALFTDIGNIWFMRKNDAFPGGEFKLNKLGKDLAIGLGTGLRVDFGLFLIRVDYAYKVKDPSPENINAQNQWFYKWKLTNGQLQLGVTYPF